MISFDYSHVTIAFAFPWRHVYVLPLNRSILLQWERCSVAKRTLQTINARSKSKHDFGKRTFQGFYAEIICKLLVEKRSVVCFLSMHERKSKVIAKTREEWEFEITHMSVYRCVWCKNPNQLTYVNKGQDLRNFFARFGRCRATNDEMRGNVENLFSLITLQTCLIKDYIYSLLVCFRLKIGQTCLCNVGKIL